MKHKLPGIILCIDFEKAFDSVNWNYLFKSFEKLNFGNIFINNIKTMYTNTEAAVVNNGNTGKFFTLQRGVRQGCPLSAYLFIIAIELLAIKICNDPSIKGIKIRNNEIKINLLADDMTLLLQNLTSVKNVLNILAYFHKCSGLKINLDKSNAKYIGSLTDDDNFPHGLSWIKTPLETLGISIVNNSDMNYKLNFQQRIVTLKSTLNIWEQRKLSIKGKITILNTLALAPLIYVSSVIETPIKEIQEINIAIQNFIWDGST